MTTTETVLVVILVILLSMFFLLCVVAMVYVVRVLKTVNRVADRAEEVVNSVEAAAEVLKDASGKLAFAKILKNVVDLTQRKK